MLTRLWRNYWAGAWIVLAGLALVPLGYLLPGQLAVLGVVSGHTAITYTWFGLWAVAAVVAVAGVAVWAYRFHTEPH
jgi:hypothetical protein